MPVINLLSFLRKDTLIYNARLEFQFSQQFSELLTFINNANKALNSN